MGAPNPDVTALVQNLALHDSATHHFFGWTGAAWIQLDN